MDTVDPDHIEDIIRRARLGDSEAFSVLYTAYFTPLYRFIYFRVGNKADADDLTQEVFLKAYAALPRYTYAGGSPLAYFYTIARNHLIDHYRKRTIPVASEEMLEAALDENDSAEESARKKELYEEVRQTLTKLPADQQDALLLRFTEGLGAEEVAVRLGKSAEAVRQLQSRGLRKIKELLQATRKNNEY